MITVLIRNPWNPLIRVLSKFVYYSCCVAFALGLAACERPTPRLAHGSPLPTQTFEHVQRLPVKVGNVQILREDAALSGRMGDFSVSIHERVMLYLSKKFETRGSFGGSFGDGGQLVVQIEDARVQHMQKQSSHSVFQRIGVDRVDHYVLSLSLKLEHRDDTGRVLYGKVLKTQKKLNISEHLSPAAREQAQFDAIEDVFMLLDPQVNQVIAQEMNL